MTAAVRVPGHAAAPVIGGAHQHPGYATGRREMRVVEITELTAGIKHFRFAAPDGSMLTPYAPGSHIIITIGDGGDRRNAYSLVDDGMYPTTYAISVLRRGEGGGSDWLHEHLVPGMAVEIEGPRSMFAPVGDQRHALLVAGGVGVTPVLSHARALLRDGNTAEIVYSYRPGHAAHLEDLRAIADRPGIALFEAHTVDDTVAVLRERLSQQRFGTHAYACGPGPLLETYTDLAAEAGWPSARVHLERFAAPEQDAGEPFTVRVASTGAEIDVPPGVSLLQRLLENGVPVSNMCRQGVCGECRIPVSSGDITHRDLVLSEDERAAGNTMLCCVSRGTDIEVDL
ncbi:2Fe-2S iron-sulfur cluster binding domain-containing protein [Gordonia pseudamarae]|jgi:ferredoxin-NADP reductase|uniref:2Fe-2S iron-sulfur cluster binding domain-containing protein n=1 Tax=Gordonia pseudamarae TaxID=2831662 RepID=A0ABX6ICM3_9ACTN|nr:MULTISPECIES: PDR/VanB family oxidoreductase [Gordonia]MBD0024000.1 oxidoreductase [Gordonia sp. (in: high G+C Gram-positive bacteria)]QHN24774.1 2Fe-2S iron-sulfur cluster binding domain-containing protein [Gordonia pseudamarae]QHN33707.1 2Fe-2S iron-sulfur cluster binding domain-containing protein [Gordonia pseudamarae]